MRLINTATRKLEEFFDQDIPPYAILSHTWDSNEVVLADYEQRIHPRWTRSADKAEAKIQKSCIVAAKDGHRYVWIDTCCIDKKSSAELSEAINSMHKWYKDAEVCYVYFQDVAKQYSWDDTATAIRKARWFTRGWTLQELLAPKRLKFYDCNWHHIHGTPIFQRPEPIQNHHPSNGNLRLDFKLAALIAEITEIDLVYIKAFRSLSQACVAERMSWAARRVTSRKEDMAYCLLGLFDVNMPLLYGEGDKAFSRLQDAIMAGTSDHTIFAWNYAIQSTHTRRTGISCLTQSPCEFTNGHLLRRDHPHRQRKHAPNPATLHYSQTNHGIQITLPVIELPRTNGTGVLVVLRCFDTRLRGSKAMKYGGSMVVLPLLRLEPDLTIFYRAPRQTRPLLITLEDLHGCVNQAMYILTSSLNHEDFQDGDSEISYTLEGLDLVITERVPYSIACAVKKNKNRLIIELGGMSDSRSPGNSELMAGLKFETRSANTNGNGSFFMLLRYVVKIENGPAVLKDFGLFSGAGWPSLSSLFLRTDPIDTFVLRSPVDSVLINPGDRLAPQHIKCRELEHGFDKEGGRMFRFCMEAKPASISARS